MTDQVLTKEDRQEALSRAYAAIIAAGAGYTLHPPADFDRDSIDIGFGAGGAMRPRLDAQLKATINLRRTGDGFRFSLKRKNYEDLRLPTQVPRILVVLALPKNDASWLNVSVRQLVLKRCAYWMSLRGAPPLKDGQASRTVHIPERNRFDVDGLQKIMAMARQGAVT